MHQDEIVFYRVLIVGLIVLFGMACLERPENKVTIKECKDLYIQPEGENGI